MHVNTKKKLEKYSHQCECKANKKSQKSKRDRGGSKEDIYIVNGNEILERKTQRHMHVRTLQFHRYEILEIMFTERLTGGKSRLKLVLTSQTKYFLSCIYSCVLYICT